MRLTIALIACVCTLAAASSVTWDKQKFVLDIFQHAPQYNVYPEEYFKFASEFKWDKYADKFGPKSAEFIEEIEKYWHTGFMSFKSFSTIDEDHLRAVKALYRVFYFAQDWETFHDVAIWARINVNPGLFGYTFYLAVTHRPDMHEVVLPAIYEIYPQFFYPSTVFEDAEKFRVYEFKGDKYEYFVPTNYTSKWYNSNKESLLAYFTEDVTLNAYYFYTHMSMPYWMDFSEYEIKHPRRGEIFFYEIKSLLARYNMERLSNGLGSIPEFSFYEPIPTGYNSMLRYYNGTYFPVRNDYFNAYTTETYYDVDVFEMMLMRFRDVVDKGYFRQYDGSNFYFTKPETIDALGNLVQANPESVFPRYFESLEKYGFELLKGSAEFTGGRIHQSPLEWPMSALRDPMFYQLYKKIMDHTYWAFKNHLPHYTEDQLVYNNVKFESVEVSKVTTYFEEFVTDFTNGVYVDAHVESVPADHAPLYHFGRKAVHKNHDLFVKATQQRLNHESFTIKINLKAEHQDKVLIKTFLGPKYDEFGHEYTMHDMREHFFQIDEQVVEVQPGFNHFERHCSEYPGYSKDTTTYFELYERMMLKDSVSFPLETGYRGFPGHLMVPKGWKGGMPAQFFFYVMPYVAENLEVFDFVGHRFAVSKYHTFGFPLDRPVYDYQWKQTGYNWYFYDTAIYHK